MIPRQFHFVFGLREQPEPLHLVFYLCLESCRRLHPSFPIFLHCHHQPYGPYWDRIQDTAALRVVPVAPDPFVASYRYPDRVLNQYRYAHHADVIRLDALIREGGIYADIDTLFVNPVPPRLLQHPFVIGREDDVQCRRTGRMQPSLCNALLASEAASPFAVAWRQRLYDAFDGSWSNHSGFLAYALSQEFPAQVHVEPPRTFYKHGFRPAGVRRLLEGLDEDVDGVVSMHLWSHLWWDRRRRDYTDVHAGLLTEDYIRSVDTTFTVAARRFLPTQDHPRRRTVAAAATVSVIIPTYNRSSLLMEAVDSVLAQTHPVHEIVVVDDGSDERHRAALEAIADRSPLVRLHALPHHGERSQARNAGLAQATGDYVLFLDDDDLLEAGTIAAAMRGFAEGAPVDAVVALGQRFGDVGRLPHAPLNPFWNDSAVEPDSWVSTWMGVSDAARRDLESHPLRVLLKGGPPIHAYVVRRDAIGTTRFPEDVRQGEDWIFWVDLAVKGCRFRVSPHGRAYVRLHSGNSRPAASSAAACRRVLQRVAAVGREEAFLAAWQWARCCWPEGGIDWWRPAIRLVKYPDLLLKYGGQFLVRQAFRLRLRLAAGFGTTAGPAVTDGPRQAPESAPR